MTVGVLLVWDTCLFKGNTIFEIPSGCQTGKDVGAMNCLPKMNTLHKLKSVLAMEVLYLWFCAS